CPTFLPCKPEASVLRESEDPTSHPVGPRSAVPSRSGSTPFLDGFSTGHPVRGTLEAHDGRGVIVRRAQGGLLNQLRRHAVVVCGSLMMIAAPAALPAIRSASQSPDRPAAAGDSTRA